MLLREHVMRTHPDVVFRPTDPSSTKFVRPGSPSGFQSVFRGTGDGSYQLVYRHHGKQVATSPFSSYEGGCDHIRRLCQEGKILGEAIDLLHRLRGLGLERIPPRLVHW